MMKLFASYYIDSIKSQMFVLELINKLIALDSDIRSLQSKMQGVDSSETLKERVAVLSIVTEYIKKTQERTKLIKDIFRGIEKAINPLLEFMEENIGSESFLTNFKYINGQLETAVECVKMSGESPVSFSKEFISRTNNCIERCNNKNEREYQMLKDNLTELLKNMINIPKVTVEEL